MDHVASSIDPENEQISYQFIKANNQTLFSDLESEQIDAILVHHIPPGSNFWFNPVLSQWTVLYWQRILLIKAVI